MAAITHLHEVPLPPPEKPKRERERRPEYEGPTIEVGGAAVWVADLQRSAADLARRHGGSVSLTIELDDGRGIEVRDLRAGPGSGFVTLGVVDDQVEREIAVRLDRVAGVELTAAKENANAFRFRRVDVGFGRMG